MAAALLRAAEEAGVAVQVKVLVQVLEREFEPPAHTELLSKR
jgi:hypothetical protein